MVKLDGFWQNDSVQSIITLVFGYVALKHIGTQPNLNEVNKIRPCNDVSGSSRFGQIKEPSCMFQW